MTENEAPRPGVPQSWSSRDMSGAFTELEHPADILVEVHGGSLSELCENALFALYCQIADLDDIRSAEKWRLEVRGTSPAEALRSLLAEALYEFDTTGRVGSAAQVRVESERDPSRGNPTRDGRDTPVRLVADVWGETLQAGRHTPLAEIKAITYHRLSVSRLGQDGWCATVLMDA
jgi:SHS2 domain-containing protein